MLNYNELQEKAKNQKAQNELKIKNYLEGLIKGLDLAPLKVDVRNSESLYTNLYALDKDGIERNKEHIVFEYDFKKIYSIKEGSQVVSNEKRLSIGVIRDWRICREENFQAYTLEILKGLMWLNEKEFTNLLESLEWDLVKEAKKAYDDNYENMLKEKEARRNKIKEELSLDYLRIGKTFQRETSDKTIEILTSYKMTPRRIYFKSNLGYNIYVSKYDLIDTMAWKKDINEPLDEVDFIIKNGTTC